LKTTPRRLAHALWVQYLSSAVVRIRMRDHSMVSAGGNMS
jgi:hypothetical protein